LKALAIELTLNRIERDTAGMIAAPNAPGLGIEIDLDALRHYLVPVEIAVGGKTLYQTPEV
jgi:L-alanine-DL-glutamate epimerase-like enolase superfamily enzyme